MKVFSWKRIISLLPIISILCLAAYLRLYRIADYMTFLGDEGRDVLVVKRMIVDHKWTLLGPTASVGGFFMGPIYYYFMLPFLWAWKLNPVGPAVMVGLFGIATVYLVYFVGKRWFSNTIGLISAFLYAVSPIVIAYSRSSWNPNIVPFFALLSMYMVSLWIKEYKSKQLFWVGLCAGIGVQLHYTYLFLIVTQGIILAFQYKKLKVKDILFIATGFCLGLAPFFAFELRHGFTNSKAIIEFVFAGKDTGFAVTTFISTIYIVITRLFGRFILNIPDAAMFKNLSQFLQVLWNIGTFVLTIAGIISLVLFTQKSYKVDNKKNILISTLFICWILIPLFFFGIYKKNIYDYYFGIFFPVPFYLTALCIREIGKIKYLGKMLASIILIGLFVLNWSGRPFRYEANRQLAQVESIAKSVLEKTDGKPFNFALITPGNSDHAYRYFFEIWNTSPVTIENEQLDPERKTVTEQLLIVCEDISCQPLGNSLWEVAGFGRAEIAGVWDVSVVKIYKLIHFQESQNSK